VSIWRRTLTIGATFAFLTATVLLIYAQQPADPPKPTGSEPPWFLAVDVAPPGTTGTFTTLFSFDNMDGAFPFNGALVQATNGDLYGTTAGVGANGHGTVFKITPSGTLTTLYGFGSQTTDGYGANAGLVQATNGYLYGTTKTGGAYGYGAVFKITPSGTLTTIYSFCARSGCPDGELPLSGLVQGTNGYLYGTTAAGGANGNLGTVFKITPSGTLTTVYSFCSQSGCADGDDPVAGLVQATDGNFYGTTDYGGAGKYGSGGTVFKITPSGKLTTLYSFCSQSRCTDGEYPYTALVQATNGDFYGTTYVGGATIGGCMLGNGCGKVFSLSVSLGPFVETDYLRQGGSRCQDSGKRSHRRNQRHL
jgi:uncharacterized repeat protein (TIGR03803 family)